MKRRLQLRVARAIIFLILIIISVMGGFLTWQFDMTSQKLHHISESKLSTALMEQLSQKGIDTTVYMSEALTNALYSYDMEQINNLISAITIQEDIIQSLVFDDTDKILHDGTALINTFGQNIPTSIANGLSKSPNDVYVLKKENRMIFAHYVFIGEEKIGGIIITFSLANIRSDIENLNSLMSKVQDSQLQTNFFSILSIAIILVILSSFLAWKITSSFVMPIVRLSKYADYIGSGKYDFDMEISDNSDEITKLSHSFNAMRNSLKKSSSQINHLAYHDTLTKLPNRRLFIKKLELAINNYDRNKTKFSLLFIDIDNFKNVNDSLGHDIGDFVLIEISTRLKNSIRLDNLTSAIGVDCSRPNEDSTISRLGGDEFTILLVNISDPFTISHIAQRIIENLSQPFTIKQHTVYVGASIGISTYPDDGLCTSNLMKHADMAMYHAKFNGKNQYQFYSSEINKQVMNELAIENDLRLALEHNQLLLHYQPQINLLNNTITSVEALISWKHPEKGYISPADFIPIAESSGLILKIGEWVIDTACMQLKSWQSTLASNLSIAINISAIQFTQTKLDEMIFETLDKYELPYHLLEIEMTETAVIKSKQDAIRILSRLSNAGIKIWMDDFGKGYSSIGYLSSLPFYGVKIDYSFIRYIHTEEKDRKLCQAIISMAHDLNLIVVAEGIEELVQENIIKQMGCDYAQGFFYAKALPSEDLFTGILDTSVFKK